MRSEKKESIAVAVVGLGVMALAGTLIVSLAWLVLGLASQLLAPRAFAQTQTRPAVELEAAIAKEQVNGDLKTAIAAYQKIAANNSAPRDVRAKALLHLAGCYEKLGQQAQSVYQQIVRDYGDQPAAKQASAKLAAMRQGSAAAPATITQHKIEGVGPLAGHVFAFNNTDGRSFLYRDRPSEAIMLGDLATGRSRLVFKPWVDSGARGFLFPSKDMSMLFGTRTPAGGKQISAVLRMDGSGYREIPGTFSGRPDWSWDNRYLLTCQDTPDGTRRRVRISASDGAIQALPGPARCTQMFSPDGRYIASAESNNSMNGIFVGPAAAEEKLLTLPGADSGSARLMGWTPDGRYLALAINRFGADGLYLVPMNDGREAGDPVLVRYGSFQIGQVYADGALVFESVPAAGQYTAWLSALDPAGRVTRWEALALNRGKSPTAPAWSPDGNRIAYVASNAAAGQDSQTVHLRDLSNGEDRELHHAGSGEMNCVWAAQHPNLFCGLATPHDTTDLFSMSIESGDARQIGSVGGKNHLLDVTPDDRGIYISSSDGQLYLWDAAAQKPAPQGPRANQGVVGWVVSSADKRWVSRLEKGQIEIRELAGGDWKAVIPGGGTQVAFSRDGNWLLYHGVDSGGRQSLLRVPVTGGQPERLGDFPTAEKIGLMWLSPDGRKIIADSLNPLDTWVLENFEPAAPKQ